MKDVSTRWAKGAADVILAVVLVGGEAVAWLAAVLLSMLLAVTGPWLPLVCLSVFAVCAGGIAAGAWSLRLWVTSAVQALVAGGCLVMLLIGLSDGFV
ncbi:hypothetical protein ABZ330_29890 [Streptomyces sp. NPDC006172]|uniref:hypothetical protein n=1 Tax=Streptomyces sp. NPDC006172 TaxID=3154470 RepID=UPI0034039263